MKNIFRKITVFVLALTLMVPSMAGISFAAESYHKITSITLSVDTSGISAGDSLDDAAEELSSKDPSTGKGRISVEKAAVPDADVKHDEKDDVKDYITVNDVDVESTTNSSYVKVGDILRVTVYLYLNHPISNTHTLKNVKIHTTGATYVSCSRAQDEVKVVFKTKAIKGQYDSPDEVEWTSTLGTGAWTAPENGSGYYNAILYRDDHKVYEVTDYYGTSFNFYPWMTKAGSYTFKVRTIAHDSNVSSSARSDWTESGDIDIEENQVSDGSGQNSQQGGGQGGTNDSGSAGWFLNNGVWYYRFPDGSLKKNGWEKVNGLWYLFDANGAMRTGWVTVDNHTYYLKDSGAMRTGWLKTTDGKWYYLNPNAGGPEGSMLKNQWLDYGGNKYYLTDSGAMATGWVKVSDRWYYFSPNANGPEGAMARNTYINSFYVGSDGAWIENY